MVSSHLRSPDELVKYLLFDEEYSDAIHNLASITHRQNLVKLWGIPQGASVLEIGCGQGDFTIPVADAVGPSGHVVAIDPGPPEYGTPPIGPSQAHIKASPVGHQIDFIRADAASYLTNVQPESFDYIVIAHTVWYFADPSQLQRIARLARGKAKTLLIAEYSLVASRPAAIPHMFTALAYNALESFRDASSTRNVRCALSPLQIIAAVAASEWVLCDSKDGILTPKNERYGRRETQSILHRGHHYVDDVEALEASDKIKTMLLGMKYTVEASVKKLEGGADNIVNMDVWAGRFETSV